MVYKESWRFVKNYSLSFLTIVYNSPFIIEVSTLGARDFSSAVSGFCQVFIVASLRPTAEAVLAFERHRKFSRTREKPLVPVWGLRLATGLFFVTIVFDEVRTKILCIHTKLIIVCVDCEQ